MGLPVAAVIPVRQFPKTTSGKIQRFALARDFEEGRFADVLAELARHDAGAAAPGAGAAGDLEQTLLAICQAALPNRTLSPDDNLFELGTGSLTLAQIYEKVEATYPGLPRGHRLLRVSDGAHDGGVPGGQRQAEGG